MEIQHMVLCTERGMFVRTEVKYECDNLLEKKKLMQIEKA